LERRENAITWCLRAFTAVILKLFLFPIYIYGKSKIYIYMNLWRVVEKGFMINAVQEIRNRPVLAKNNRIIIFGED
jgi:hypothetical protein